MFSFDFSDPKKSIETMLHQANETSIELFRKNESFVDDYVDTDFLTYEKSSRI